MQNLNFITQLIRETLWFNESCIVINWEVFGVTTLLESSR